MTAEQKAALLNGTSAGVSGATPTWTDFVFTNPTPGTAITSTIAGSFSATASAFFSFRNVSPTSNPAGVRTYLDYIKLITNVVPASGTSFQYAIYSDGETSNRYTSGGTSISPVNPSATSLVASQTQLYAGAITTAAASSQARLLSRGSLRGVIPVTGDEYLIGFGDGTFGAANCPGATAAGRFVANSPVVSFGPQQFLEVFFWWPSNSSTAATFEFEIGYFETPVT